MSEEENVNITVYRVFSCDFEEVTYPLTLCFWFSAIILTRFIQYKVRGITETSKFFRWVNGIPESCLLMLLGLCIGFIVPTDDFDSSKNLDILEILIRFFFEKNFGKKYFFFEIISFFNFS